MIRQIASLKMQHRRWLPLLLSTFLVLAASSSAHADLIVAAQTVAANAGSSGNTLELTLQNTGPSAVTIGGFSFGVSTSGTDINFTLADINTALAPYIFKGNSLFGPNINTSTGHSLTASDLDSDPAGATVSAASTVGLGRLFFDVSPAASAGPHTVTIEPFPATSLSDPSGNDVPITATVPGAIIVPAGPQLVPEPATVYSAAAALVAGAWFWTRRRRLQRCLA